MILLTAQLWLPQAIEAKKREKEQYEAQLAAAIAAAIAKLERPHHYNTVDGEGAI